MGYFTWTFANKKLHETRTGDFLNKCKLPYGGYGCVLCPDGTTIEEPHYEGYGIFNGKDVYELVVDWNRHHLMSILRNKGIITGVYPAIANAYQTRNEAEAAAIVKKYVEAGEAPRYLLTDWKRSLGVEIACTNNPNIPFPIKIVSTPHPRLTYDKLPPSISTQ